MLCPDSLFSLVLARFPFGFPTDQHRHTVRVSIAVLEFLAQSITADEVPREGISSALDLLRAHVLAAQQLCVFGYFDPLITAPGRIHDLQRLLELVSFRSMN